MIQVNCGGSTTTLNELVYNGTTITEAWVCDKTARVCRKVFPLVCLSVLPLCSCWNDVDKTWTNTGTDCTYYCDLYGDWRDAHTYSEFASACLSLSQYASSGPYLGNTVNFTCSPQIPLSICASACAQFSITATYKFDNGAYIARSTINNYCSCPATVTLCGEVCSGCHCFDFEVCSPSFEVSCTFTYSIGAGNCSSKCLPICKLATGRAQAEGYNGTTPTYGTYFSICNLLITCASKVCRCLVFTVCGCEVYNSGWRRACDALSFCY